MTKPDNGKTYSYRQMKRLVEELGGTVGQQPKYSIWKRHTPTGWESYDCRVDSVGNHRFIREGR